jgi:uncharacterized protein YecT (DUF1311 family)
MKSRSMKLAAFVGIAAGLLAQTPNHAGQAASECANPVTTAAMRNCEASRYTIALQELSAAYQGLMKRLDRGQKEKLRITQRAWLRYRDANADFQASLIQGGTLAPLVKVSSLTEMTKARTQELKREAQP